jgi:hypothetical protein
MNCWVNKAAVGIALIDEGASYPKLKYVFDVADIHKAKRIGRIPHLWEIREEHTGAILKRLENTYGNVDQKQGFANCLLEIAERITLESYESYVGDLSYLTEQSYLGGEMNIQ